ncbi:nickel pincer cofactor biosynthesis protein LarB [uncultured Enterococcus sp.]|uniref:nickel pincer cofactor biosynthesis protein LarB n=1 Tax=uncultured Enterococcus sp. TaxID=167972 RepID=UPI002582C1ED|nr:nickel pincer cofactor biosynthesis protein LarB [uncultured Enterococcus sp.]
MDKKELLRNVQLGKLSVEEAAEKLTGFNELGYAKIDTQRKERNGFPEIIYGEGKNLEQIIGIVTVLKEEQKPILATRISSEKGRALQDTFPDGSYFELARCFVLQPVKPYSETYIAIVTAGTSDVPVAEEAAVTAETFGNQVKRIYDVGVAGIHRLFARLEEIQQASVVIVIAGMEGALVSVVGGLVDVPVIAVPTSIGYGSNFQGMTALLGMLNSCSSGVSVVNIDNGFGAAYSASMINQLRRKK